MLAGADHQACCFDGGGEAWFGGSVARNAMAGGDTCPLRGAVEARMLAGICVQAASTKPWPATDR